MKMMGGAVHRKKDFPSGIRNLCCVCLIVVMGVVLPSVLSIFLIAELAVLLVGGIMKFVMLLGTWLLLCGTQL